MIYFIIIAVLIMVGIIILKKKKKDQSDENISQESVQVQPLSSKQLKLSEITKNDIYAKLLDSFNEYYKDFNPINMSDDGFLASTLNIKINKKMVLKVFKPLEQGNQKAIQSFMNECDSLKKMNHPNIIRIYDVGTFENLYYYFMEYLEGINLENLVKKEKQLSIEKTLDIAIKVSRALKHCHDNNVIHRDIMPSNILVTFNDTVKIIDFGLVKVIIDEESQIKGTTKVGNPDFASPEQIQGQIISGKSDVYSLGVCLFYMLTASLPFKSSAVASRVVEDPIDIKTIRRDVPLKLAEIINGCLISDPQKRFSSSKVWNELKSITL